MTASTMLLREPTTTTARSAVAAADELFTLHGVGPVPLQDVADLAGLHIDAVRAEFPDDRDLVIAALARRHRSWFDGLVLATDAHAEPRDQLLAVFGYLETGFDDASFRGCAFINGFGEFGRDDPGIAHLADEHLSRTEAHIAGICVRAELPAHLADAVTLLVQGAHVEAAIHRSSRPARSARQAVAMLMSVYESRSDRR